MSASLSGRRIILTRAGAQTGSLRRGLEGLGAEVLSAPAIAIAPPEDPSGLEAAAARLGQADWLVFTSANGVDAVMEALGAAPSDLGFGGRCACVGPATALRLRAIGLDAALLPEAHHAEGLLEAFAGEEMAGRRVLLFQGNRARAALREGLIRQGASVDAVVAYRTVAADPGPALRAFLKDGADAIVFASGSAGESCAAALGSEGLAKALVGVAVVSIGPKTSEVLRRLGLRELIEARPHSAEGIIEALRLNLGPA